jgi:hypothetical protein
LRIFFKHLKSAEGEDILSRLVLHVWCCVVAFVLFAVGSVFSSDENVESASQTQKTEVSGYGAIEYGKTVHGRYQYSQSIPDISTFLGHAYSALSVKSRLNEHLSVRISLESRFWYVSSPLFLVPDASSFGATSQYWDITIPSAEAILSFGDKESASFTIDIGRFEYKYNPQAQDLGEYLFRTGCYPAYIRTNFDFPAARVNGIALSNKISDFLRQDLLLTTMGDVRPYFDLTLTYIANLSLGKAFNLGGGIQFDRFVSADSTETLNTYNAGNGYINSKGDTSYYTFSGTKLMMRFMFDPKRLFDVPFFGEKDGIIYAEAAILGLKNYPRTDTNNIFGNIYGYDKIFGKMPVMIGFNIPTLKLLDVLSVEGEWFGSKYQDSYESYMNRKPAPAHPTNQATEETYKHDDWKWVIYAKKTIFGGLSLIGLLGRDHFRTETYIGQYKDYGATFELPNNRYWMVKMSYIF